jgi:hypothetical protein
MECAVIFGFQLGISLKDDAWFSLHAQAVDATLERRKNYCSLAVALAEDLPMGMPRPSVRPYVP